MTEKPPNIRLAWDHTPSDRKMFYLYEWNEMLNLEIQELRAQVRALETRLATVEGRAEDNPQ